MRLIDARVAAVELAKIMAYEANMENNVAGFYRHTKDDFLDVAESLLENVPTIEAEPVRRGRWLAIKEKAPWLVCSECGTYLYNEQKSVTKYCYNCGAKMEDEECD